MPTWINDAAQVRRIVTFCAQGEWRREIDADETSPLFALWSGFADSETVPAFGTKRCEVDRMLVQTGAVVDDDAIGAVPIECGAFDVNVAIAMLGWMEQRGEL